MICKFHQEWVRKMGTLMYRNLECKLVQPNWGTVQQNLCKYNRDYPFKGQLHVWQSTPQKHLLICTIYFVIAKYQSNLQSSIVGWWNKQLHLYSVMLCSYTKNVIYPFICPNIERPQDIMLRKRTKSWKNIESKISFIF